MLFFSIKCLVVYECISKLPYLHQVLANTFARIREKAVAPDYCGSCKIVLIQKKNKGDPNSEPRNFRMISLTLNIGKLYRTLEAQKLWTFCYKIYKWTKKHL